MLWESLQYRYPEFLSQLHLVFSDALEELIQVPPGQPEQMCAAGNNLDLQ